MTPLTVQIAYDPAAHLWITEATEVPGLIALDESHDGLLDQIQQVAPELLARNQESTLLKYDRDSDYNVFVTERTDERVVTVRSFRVFQPALPEYRY